jgi:ferric-dicitrate binding protein FerR (iron transport regulator)
MNTWIELGGTRIRRNALRNIQAEDWIAREMSGNFTDEEAEYLRQWKYLNSTNAASYERLQTTLAILERSMNEILETRYFEDLSKLAKRSN